MEKGKTFAGAVALAAIIALSWLGVGTAGAGGEGIPAVLRLLEEILANQAVLLHQLEIVKAPDLVPNPYQHHLGPEGPADFCRILESGKLWVSVYNQGAGSAAPSVTQVFFRVPPDVSVQKSCGVGCAEVDVVTAGMASFRGVELAVAIPEGCFGSAFGPDDINNCQFKIFVDGTNLLNESNELNNNAFGACQGLV